MASVKAQIIEGGRLSLIVQDPSCFTRYCGKLKARAPNGADSQTTNDCSVSYGDGSRRDFLSHHTQFPLVSVSN